MVDSFLRRVLPETGRYVVVSISGTSGAREVRGLPDVPAALSAIERLSQYKTNIYFAVGSYAADRKEPLAKRCLFVDVDPKGYPTKPAQVSAIAAFCKATAFPLPSIFVDSGHGIHAYWCFDRDVSINEWRPIAEALKKRCIEADLRADHGVTADVARILRVPGTLNHKRETPIPCRVLKDTGTSYAPADLLAALSPSISNALTTLAAAVGANDLGGALDSNSYPQVPYYATEVASKCGVMKEAVDTGGRDHTEPHWRHLLSLLAFTEDGDKLVHEISDAHVCYNAADADAKYAALLKLKAESKLKPILCATFATYRPSICAACPYNGHIKTPMVLGKLESTAFLPSGYRMADYSIQKLVKKGDSEVPDVWMDAFPYRVSDVETLDPGDGGALQVRMMLSSRLRVTKLTFEHMLMFMQGDALPLEFARNRLWVTPQQLTEFKGFMTTWLRKMTDVKTSVAIELTGLGWGKRGNKPAFVAGATVFADDGSEYDFHIQDPTMLRNYKPRGDISVWKTAANAIAGDRRQAAVATLLTAFAAPLIVFTGVKGLTYSLYSSDSATGKSSILRTAQAVWGHPTHGMAMVNDTQASVINKLGFLNTIPAYWDELRSGESLISFVQMIFTLGQGREKTRLTSSIKQQAAGSWETLVTIASNERIADHVDTYIKNTDAGRLRLFEVSLGPLVHVDPAISRTFSRLETNYGHAGVIYGKYLATHRSEAEALVHSIQDMLRTKVSTNPNERYWLALIATLCAAATLVERAGLLKIDRVRLMTWLISQIQAQKAGVETNYKSPAEAALASVFSFVDMNRNKLLLVEEFNGTGLSKYGNILTAPNMQPRDEITVIKAVNEKKIRIKYSAWKKYVVTVLGHSPSTLQAELTKLGAGLGRRSMSAGIQSASGALVGCIELDLTKPIFASLLEDQ